MSKDVNTTGKRLSLLSRSMSRTITLTARSTGIRNGIRNAFLSVSGVLTNPGLTTVTLIPRGSRSNRSASSAKLSAAFEAPYAAAVGSAR